MIRARLIYILVSLFIKINFTNYLIILAIKLGIKRSNDCNYNMDKIETLLSKITSFVSIEKKYTSCLVIALSQFYLLRANRYNVIFHIGIREEPFMAHAWIDYYIDDKKYSTSDDQYYILF